MSFPKVSVAILNWNGKSWLEKFLPSLQTSTYPNLEVIVIDNASTDDSVSFMKDSYPDFRLLIWDKNYGFAEGYNKVLDHVDASFISFYLIVMQKSLLPGWNLLLQQWRKIRN